MKSPYEICPVFETENFILRLILEDDSKDLLSCYSDSKAQIFFNSDKCTGDFRIYKIEDMLQCTKAWIHAYSQQEFIRFTIIDKSLSKAIGTVEMFGYVGKYKVKTGILRVDISSQYEKANYLSEIFSVCDKNFFDLFEVDSIATKAIPQAIERRKALEEIDFIESNVHEGEYYFLRSK